MLESAIEFFKSLGPAIFTTVVFILLYIGVQKLIERQSKGKVDKGLIRSIILFLILLVGFISIILALPLEEAQKGQITSLIGIVLSAVLGLSSTTFIGNALAGIMLKSRKSFKPGDFITVNDVFGRVTEQGLFHTEIQTVDRDLTTLPNMTLATNAVKVTRSSGTFINAEVSLGYDVSKTKIIECLKKAAINANLSDPFVHVISLGDFSIVYRIHGLLQDVKSILSAKSLLTSEVIDVLHNANIEIVSPNFMNQKQVGDTVFIPKRERKVQAEPTQDKMPEELIFDKAEQAESIEKRKEILANVEEKIKKEQKELKEVKDTAAKEKIKSKLESTKELKEKLIDKIDKRMDELDSQ